MRAALVLACVVACGGGAAKKTATTTTTTAGSGAPAADPNVPATRDALVAATFAALAKGDGAALAKLADRDAMIARAATCKTKPDLHDAAEKLHGKAGELAGKLHDSKTTLEFVRLNDDKVTKTIAVGQDVEAGCAARAVVELHDVDVDVRVAAPGGSPLATHAVVKAVSVGGSAWYLDAIPDLFLPAAADTTVAELETKFREFTDKMCACKDKACADKVSAAMTKWSEDVQSRYRDIKPTEAQMKRIQDVAQRMATCMMNAMGNGGDSP